MALARAAASDLRYALTRTEIDQAVRRVSERDGLDFTQGHGLAQRRIIDVLATSGRFAVAVGRRRSRKDDPVAPTGGRLGPARSGRRGSDGIRNSAGLAAIRSAGRCRDRARKYHGDRRAVDPGGK